MNISDKQKLFIEETRKKYSNTSQVPVSIIAPTCKPEYINNIFMNYGRLHYTEKELIIILNNNKLSLQEYKRKAEQFKNVRVFQLDESCTLGQCLNFGIEKSIYDYISKMDDDDYYGSNYLTDLMNVFKYTKAKVTGKLTYLVYFEYNNTLGIMCKNYEHRYVPSVAGGTIVAKKEVFDKIKFQDYNSGIDTKFLKDCRKLKIPIYSSDKYNYVLMRHINLKNHTWKIKSEKFIKYVDKICVTPDFIPLVTV